MFWRKINVKNKAVLITGNCLRFLSLSLYNLKICNNYSVFIKININYFNN